MHKSFQSLDELFDYLKVDKEWEGAEATMHNRYPIRFILFENRSYHRRSNYHSDAPSSFCLPG